MMEYALLTEQEQLVHLLERQDNINEIKISDVPAYLRDKIEFLREIAVKAGIAVRDLVNLVKDRLVYQFFAAIGWSLTHLWQLLRSGYELADELASTITEWASHNEVTKWTTVHLRDLDQYLSQHPIAAKITGLTAAGLVVFMWINMTFTGRVGYDFDLRAVVDALKGKAKLSTIFGGKKGFKLLSLFALGFTTGVTFPYPGPTSALFIGALIYSLVKSSDKNREVDISQLSLPRRRPDPFRYMSVGGLPIESRAGRLSKRLALV